MNNMLWSKSNPMNMFKIIAVGYDSKGVDALVEVTVNVINIRLETYFLAKDISVFLDELHDISQGAQSDITLESFDGVDEIRIVLPSFNARDICVQLIHDTSYGDSVIPLQTRNDELQTTSFVRTGWFAVERSYIESWTRALGERLNEQAWYKADARQMPGS